MNPVHITEYFDAADAMSRSDILVFTDLDAVQNSKKEWESTGPKRKALITTRVPDTRSAPVPEASNNL